MHLRASSIALRGLHHRIDAVVGQADGHTAYSIDTVRVVLSKGRAPLSPCRALRNVRRDVVEHGRPVLGRVDLHGPANVLCRTCGSRLG
jgi:hypothetical protein